MSIDTTTTQQGRAEIAESKETLVRWIRDIAIATGLSKGKAALLDAYHLQSYAQGNIYAMVSKGKALSKLNRQLLRKVDQLAQLDMWHGQPNNNATHNNASIAEEEV